MCQAIEELIAESEARGEVRGKAEGMIEMCLEMNIPKKGIIKRLQDKLNISMQQADEYFRMYGTKRDYISEKHKTGRQEFSYMNSHLPVFLILPEYQ